MGLRRRVLKSRCQCGKPIGVDASVALDKAGGPARGLRSDEAEAAPWGNIGDHITLDCRLMAVTLGAVTGCRFGGSFSAKGRPRNEGCLLSDGHDAALDDPSRVSVKGDGDHQVLAQAYEEIIRRSRPRNHCARAAWTCRADSWQRNARQAPPPWPSEHRRRLRLWWPPRSPRERTDVDRR